MKKSEKKVLQVKEGVTSNDNKKTVADLTKINSKGDSSINSKPELQEDYAKKQKQMNDLWKKSLEGQNSKVNAAQRLDMVRKHLEPPQMTSDPAYKRDMVQGWWEERSTLKGEMNPKRFEELDALYLKWAKIPEVGIKQERVRRWEDARKTEGEEAS